MKKFSCYPTILLICFLLSSFTPPEINRPVYYPDTKLKLREFLKSKHENAEMFRLSSELLQTIKKRDEKAQIRNGDLGKALIAIRAYRKLAAAFQEKKTDVTLVTFKEKHPITFKVENPKMQTAIVNFKAQMIKVLETEAVMERQQRHFPELFERINQLKNTNGQPLRVYIFSHNQLPDLPCHKPRFNALTIMAKAEGLFTSDTPMLRQLLPDLKKCNNAISVHIVFNQPGKVLSHEFGHIIYLYHNWENYQKYIKEQGENYKFGGHSSGDPNGEAADKAENGKMPVSFSNQ